MGYISSINFKKTIPIQSKHNDRYTPPSYLIGGEFEVNRDSFEALQLKNQIVEDAKKKYQEVINQPFKAKSYEWSAVVNLKPDSTMADLEKIANHFQNKYGFQCYQMAIHRDEGHIDDNGNKVINHHAHLEFITLDKNTGKSLFRADLQRPKALRQMQDEVAEILQMERGLDKRKSKRKRIEPRAYAQIKEAEKKNIKKLQEELAEVKKENHELREKQLTQTQINKIKKEFIKSHTNQGYTKEFFDDIRKLCKEIKNTTATELAELLEQIVDKHDQLKEAHDREIAELNDKLANKEAELETAKQSAQTQIEAIKKEAETAFKVEIEDLESKLGNKTQELETAQNTIKTQSKELQASQDREKQQALQITTLTSDLEAEKKKASDIIKELQEIDNLARNEWNQLADTDEEEIDNKIYEIEKSEKFSISKVFNLFVDGFYYFKNKCYNLYEYIAKLEVENKELRKRLEYYQEEESKDSNTQNNSSIRRML